jgi:iron complex outermembrane receptor protein
METEMTHKTSRRPVPAARPADRPLTAVALAAALAVMGVAAHAQGAAAPAPTASAAKADDDTSTVVVTGIRAAAETAQALKKDSDKVSDSIVADDIGKFPDTNVANALARVTGIQIRRDSGEASTVLIRGLPGVETLYNGREVFTTTGRFIALADVPVAMVNRVDVLKSATPDVPEGGIAGVIDVRTHRPFDFAGFKADVNIKDTHADKADGWNPNIGGMISNRWNTPIGEIGALFGLSALKDKFHEERAFNTAPVDKSWLLGADGTGPDLVGLISINGVRQRTAGNLALEWKPNSYSGFYLEGMRTRLINNSALDYFVGLPWWGPGDTMSATLFPGTTQMKTLTSHNVNTIDSTQANWADSKTAQYALGGHVDVSPTWRVSGEAAVTQSTYNWRNPILDTITNVPNAFVDTNRGGTMHLEYTGIDMTDASNFYMKGFFDRYGEDKGDSHDFRGDISYTPEADGFLKEWSSGVRLARRYATSIKSKEGNVESQYYDATKAFPWTQSVTSIPGLNCVTRGMSGGGPDYGLNKWYTPCADFLLDHTDVIREAITGSSDPKDLDPGSFFSDRENTLSLYTQAKVGMDLGSVPVSGTVGVRLVNSVQNLTGTGSTTLLNGSVSYAPINSRDSQTLALPSANFKFSLTPQLIGRLAAGRTLTRQNFSDLNPGVALINSSDTVKATGTGGNPNLKAVTGDNYEAALEWYFAKAGSVTATSFFHHFNGYIGYAKADEVYNGTTYSVTRPYNTSNGDLRGFELGYQQFYDKLPGLLGGFGLGANATFMNGTETVSSGAVRPITGVSRFSYNVAALYEKYGLSGRLAYNWRSKFIDTYDSATDGAGKSLDLIVSPMSSLDGNLTYHVTPKFSVMIEGTNLLNFTYHDYWSDKALYLRDTRRFDRTGAIGLSWSL